MGAFMGRLQRPRGRLCAIIRTSTHPDEVPAISFFLAKRFASFVLTLLAASVVIFTVLDVLPGNAAEVMLGESATPESLAALTAKLGLDRPPLVRYADWMKGLATGDLGLSTAYDTPITQLIGERLRVTVPLALLAMALTTGLAFSLGLFAAARHGRAGDVGIMAVSQVGIAIPNFWFAILLILVFSVKLRWFSAGGFPGWSEGWGPALQDYLYIAATNSIAFSPTDAMPLTHRAKLVMGVESFIAAVTLLIVAARAVNILQG